jgi:hypothetical protein
MRTTQRLSNEELAASFWSQVDQSAGADGCWLWLGRLSAHGVPIFPIPGVASNRTAARTAYILAYGPLPPGMRVWQRPGEPLCVNPAHLTAGTPAEHSHFLGLCRQAP